MPKFIKVESVIKVQSKIIGITRLIIFIITVRTGKIIIIIIIKIISASFSFRLGTVRKTITIIN